MGPHSAVSRNRSHPAPVGDRSVDSPREWMLSPQEGRCCATPIVSSTHYLARRDAITAEVRPSANTVPSDSHTYGHVAPEKKWLMGAVHQGASGGRFTWCRRPEKVAVLPRRPVPCFVTVGCCPPGMFCHRPNLVAAVQFHAANEPAALALSLVGAVGCHQSRGYRLSVCRVAFARITAAL